MTGCLGYPVVSDIRAFPWTQAKLDFRIETSARHRKPIRLLSLGQGMKRNPSEVKIRVGSLALT